MRDSVSDIKSKVRDAGGKVTNVRYIQHGRDTSANIEAYFDNFVWFETGDNVHVDDSWDPEHNVTFEVTL